MSVCVCARVCVCVWGSITRWLEHRLGNWQASGSMSSYAKLVLFPWAKKTLLTLFQSTQLYNGDLVAWCQLGKQPTQLYHQWVPGEANAELYMSCIVGEGTGGTSGATPLPVWHGAASWGHQLCPRRIYLRWLIAPEFSQCWFTG